MAEPQGQTNRRIPWIVLGLAALVFATSAVAIYTSDSARQARERDERLAEAEASGRGPRQPGASLEVDVVRVQRTALPDVVELSGVLEPVRSTWVAAETAGRIVEVAVEEHSAVAANDVLVRLDPELARAAVIRAEAAHVLAKSELARQQRLGKRSVASEAELDEAIAEERNTYAALLEARKRLTDTEIRAPFDGLVNSLDFDPGAYVAPGTAIAEILDVASIEVAVPVSDRQVGALTKGQPARVRVDPLGNAVRAGKIARVGRAPNGETQRFPVVIELENTDGRLLPGMLAHVELEIGAAESMRVPSRAVVHEFELDYVFVLEASEIPGESLVRRVRIDTRPVPFRPDWVEVVGGLEDGLDVAVSSITELRDGLRVRVVSGGGPA
jgi:membrane fusion protein (multidrug efflux system)